MQQDNITTNFPSVHWERFFSKFSEIETLPIEQWKEAHLLGYFCYLYQKQYGVSYTFKFNSTAPSKSYEIFRLHSIMQMISIDPIIVKDYIDWVFEHKVIRAKKRFTSISFISNAIYANEYKLQKLAMDKKVTIDRTTKLPPNYQSVVSGLKIKCFTYGDLAFIFKTATEDAESKELIEQLQKIGFDPNILNKVS